LLAVRLRPTGWSEMRAALTILSVLIGWVVGVWLYAAVLGLFGVGSAGGIHIGALLTGFVGAGAGMAVSQRLRRRHNARASDEVS